MPAEYTGFEVNGYDEDIETDSASFAHKKITGHSMGGIQKINKEEHQLNKLIDISPFFSNNANGNVFNQAQRSNNGKLYFSLIHNEHPQSFGRINHIYSKSIGN